MNGVSAAPKSKWQSELSRRLPGKSIPDASQRMHGFRPDADLKELAANLGFSFSVTEYPVLVQSLVEHIFSLDMRLAQMEQQREVQIQHERGRQARPSHRWWPIR
jgi:hypothetical protein